LTCWQNDRIGDLPVRDRIALDAHWRVAHALAAPLVGWLVLVPRRHVTAVADLRDVEAAALGGWQVRVSRALHAVLGCTKTYVAQFAEAEGFHHVHFHLIPRMPDLPAELRGPRIFGVLDRSEDQRLNDDAVDGVSTAIRAHLT
jgi:diadenosine tetraphosphate (Ap4A) HIT family hydrolase